MLRNLTLGALLLAVLLAPSLVLAGQMKNVKHLPDDKGQVMKIMAQWNKALGVKCTDCHKAVKTADLDDHPNKAISRDMVVLTEQVNAAMTAKNPAWKVTCFTCHQGKSKIPQP